MPVDPEWAEQLSETGELTPDIVGEILSEHGNRGKRAIDALAERRVKEYKDFTVVVGHEEEYIVEGRACTCKDMRYNLDPEDPLDLCWHVLATIMAQRLGLIDAHDMWYSEVREIL